MTSTTSPYGSSKDSLRSPRAFPPRPLADLASSMPTMQVRLGGRVINPSGQTTTTPRQHPASVFREGATTTFMDLPTEIRYAIYGCILEEEDPIMLKMISRQGAPREIARYGNHRDIRHRGEVYDASLRQWVPAPPTHTAIMFVNHQVYAEATSCLYGNNTFRFMSTTALKDFLQHLGPRVQYLRNIEVGDGGYVKSSIRGAISLLCQAKGLRKLSFGHFDFCGEQYLSGGWPVEILALAVRPLLRSLCSSYKELNVSTDVLDVVSISLADCHYCHWKGAPTYHNRVTIHRHRDRRCRCECAKAGQKNDEFNAKLRALNAKMLARSADSTTKDD